MTIGLMNLAAYGVDAFAGLGSLTMRPFARILDDSKGERKEKADIPPDWPCWQSRSIPTDGLGLRIPVV
ncbi:hypothetical protein [Jiella pacifica]|uniref:Uncharacterized protein n=1 Tax=Jiella pacifica TaxID=2696469 RepID=A0A6N9T8F9_9HYPH|nr:hypothetical protein [Jiella pacifica]NDW07717.1 hypothetical protein [Jiella pacifica]